MAQIRASPLFIIERSENTNVVHYDARITANGKLNPKELVIAYGVLLAKDDRREKLSSVEKKGLLFYHQAGPVGKRL